MCVQIWIIQEVSYGSPHNPIICFDVESARKIWLGLWNAGFKRDIASRPIRETKAWSKEFLQNVLDKNNYINRWFVENV